MEASDKKRRKVKKKKQPAPGGKGDKAKMDSNPALPPLPSTSLSAASSSPSTSSSTSSSTQSSTAASSALISSAPATAKTTKKKHFKRKRAAVVMADDADKSVKQSKELENVAVQEKANLGKEDIVIDNQIVSMDEQDEDEDVEEEDKTPVMDAEAFSAVQRMAEGESRQRPKHLLQAEKINQEEEDVVSGLPSLPLAKKKKKKPTVQVIEARPADDTPSPLQALIRKKFKKVVSERKGLPLLQYTAAPMVGKSDLAFRMLCRRYGTQTAWTPMYEAHKFVEDAGYRAQFQTHATDRPLAVQFCANDPDSFFKAAKLVESQCDLIDLNLGCPQRRAHAGHYGAFLLDEPDHELVYAMVRKASEGLSIPIACKIRLLSTPEATLKFCLGLQEAGCAMIAVHARYRGSPTQPRDGPAHLEQLPALKKALSVPVLANGNTRTYEDVVNNIQSTQCDGIMSAEGLLDNPALFAKAVGKDGPDGPELALEYLKLCREVGAPSVDWVKGNVLRMCRKLLFRFQLNGDLEQGRDFSQVEQVVARLIQYRNNPSSFKADPAKTKALQSALSAQKLAKKQARQEEFRQKKIARRAAERASREQAGVK